MSERAAQAHAAARSPLENAAVGIDVGSTNTKVLLLSLGPRSGADTARVSFPTPDDPSGLVTGVERAIGELLAGHPCRPVAVGVASMAETGVPLDADGDPVGAFVRWNRSATSGPASALVTRLGADALHSATGVPPVGKAPLLVWEALRDAEPERWSRLVRWAGAGDLVTRALTGRLVTDHTLAGRTLAYRLPPPGGALPDEFDAALLAEVGLRPDALPEVAAAGHAAGAVTAHAAARTGLTTGTPVFVAGHDHAVGSWGVGVRRMGERADSVGTSEALLRIAGAPLDRATALQAGMSITRTVAGDAETLLAGSPAGGSLIAALLHGEFSGGRPLDAGELFSAVPSGAPATLVLPYPLGRQCPAPDAAARLRFIDLDGDDVDPATLEPPELAHAVLEGICLQLRWMRDVQQGLTGEPVTGALRLIGGAAVGNTAWLRLRAEVLGERLEPGTAEEPVAAAAALLAAVRAGAADPDAVLPVRSGPKPPPASADRHDAAFAAFVAAATARTSMPLTPA